MVLFVKIGARRLKIFVVYKLRYLYYIYCNFRKTCFDFQNPAHSCQFWCILDKSGQGIESQNQFFLNYGKMVGVRAVKTTYLTQTQLFKS